jgi:predicted  nucleic acid-binding Zn-ribbon protein
MKEREAPDKAAGFGKEKALSTVEDDIAIDPNAGISEDEQREILAEINRITAKNRLSLSEDSPEAGGVKNEFKAAKKGGLFPALVNAAALILLAGGIFFLLSFQVKEDVNIREGDRIYNIAEKALIEEIRRETASQLAAKENEIALMTGKLSGVDTELQRLQDSLEALMNNKEAELRKEMSEAFSAERRRLVEQNLSEAAIAERMRLFDAERIAGMNAELADYRRQLDSERAGSESALKSLQEEYRLSLSSLQQERSHLLESSRAREAALRTQLEAKTLELAAITEQAKISLGEARGELERLSSDQEKAAVIEAQLGGYYVLVNEQIRKGLLEEAPGTLRVMREYINTPAFQSIRSIQARKSLYAASIDILEDVINEISSREAPAPADNGDEEQIITDLWRKNAELEERLEALNKTAASSTASETALKTRAADLERRLAAAASGENTMRTRNTALEREAAEKERTVAALQSENSTLNQTVAARDTTISELRGANASQEETIKNLNTQLATIREALQALSQ